MPDTPLPVVLIGLGHRTLLYGSYALAHPDELTVVGLADPDRGRLERAADLFGVPPERCYATSKELAAQPHFADAAINGTMDRQHVPTTLPLLEAGYHVLLEKPIAPGQPELLQLLAVARKTQRILMICHVLRYAPFYVAIREHVLAGEIGEIVSINSTERVSYHHMAVGFVRGKWRKRAESNPMLLAKCCHDLDLICWFKSGIAPRHVASHGNLMVFRPEKAPPGSGTRCLADCQIEDSCPYSARKNYIDQGLWRFYAWESLEQELPLASTPEPTLEQKLESLRTDNPMGRCVWHCDNDVVDHQSVIVDLADGCVATHTMVGGASRPCRTIHLVGTQGEIEGTMEQGYFVVRHPDARAGHEYAETRVDIDVSGEMHGGGDFRLVKDFISALRGEPASLSSTSIEDSVYGHLIAYAADRAMQEHQVIEITDIS